MGVVPPLETGQPWSHIRANEPFGVDSATYESGTDTLTAEVGNGRVELADGTLFELADVSSHTTARSVSPVTASSTYYVYIDQSAGDVVISATAPEPSDLPIAEVDVDGTKAVTSITDVRSLWTRDTTPTGVVLEFAGAAGKVPPGYLLCDGSAVSRTTFARLFDVIGTVHGGGDGTTTFNLPDRAGRVGIGVGTLGSDTYALGDAGGSARHTLTSSEMPSHAHAGPSHTHSGPSHNHAVNPPATTTTSDNHSHSIRTSLNEWISGESNSYVNTGSDSGGRTANNTAPIWDDAHTHSVNIPSFNSSSAGTGATGASGTGSTSQAGGGNAHENRPPFLAANFIIRT